MENLGTAFGLLFIGIIMVMIVLSLVVVLGNLIINLTNKYMHGDKPDGNTKQGKRVHTRKVAAIAAAVDVVTQGQGRVESIQKK
ncbi:MAG: oxaloacetate decarboxylase [Fermentimonas sp.]|jgi:oxaloacetate decarboxylase gamma subunit|nr:oxaloacetate decarboxylase [Fermentimonas sp.]MDD3189923.1 oxaloacetate decarboxylase [Fermentimonas sp.]MDD3511467.1 oxaloacetate decarboxylase [Fermentimonas sp.]MDD4284020.1 oxaloacetate decarboxylase [Fermentimonas sp.]